MSLWVSPQLLKNQIFHVSLHFSNTAHFLCLDRTQFLVSLVKPEITSFLALVIYLLLYCHNTDVVALALVWLQQRSFISADS